MQAKKTRKTSGCSGNVYWVAVCILNTDERRIIYLGCYTAIISYELTFSPPCVPECQSCCFSVILEILNWLSFSLTRNDCKMEAELSFELISWWRTASWSISWPDFSHYSHQNSASKKKKKNVELKLYMRFVVLIFHFTSYCRNLPCH